MSLCQRVSVRQLAAGCALVALLLPALSAAQYVYDAPSLAVVGADKSSITLQVTAGATGLPEGFTVQWMRAADFTGTWPTGSSGYVGYCSFTGTPTLTRGPAGTYALAGNANINVELGDLFDETGISTGNTDELPESTPYVFRAFSGIPYYRSSNYSATINGSTITLDTGCVRTQGFWKNHEESWPVGGLFLGTTFYTQAELIQILDTQAQGNGLIFLAHQLIAAKLNVASGATPPGTLIADADALIDGLVVPPIGGGFLDPSVASPLTDDLDTYNNGLSGVPHCDSVPAESKPWSEVKTLYRD